jgi:hypothetical protein
MQQLEQHQVERQRVSTPSSRTELERRNKSFNPPNRLPRSCTQTQNLPNNYQYDLYWPLASNPMLCVCFVVVECNGRAKEPIYGCSFSYASMSSFNSNSSIFNPSHPHVLSSHHTHLTTLSHSLGDKDDSLLCLASSAKARIQHKNPRGREERTPLTNQGSAGYRNVHI